MNAGPLSDRAHLAPGHAVGVTEDMIHDLVHAFYAKIRVDPALAPIFNRAIGDGWDRHLAKMCDFWSPMSTHARLAELRATHFARWLHLFSQTAATVCPPEAAALFIAKSEIIAQSLQLGIDAARGVLPRVASPSPPRGSPP
jgi:hemoglobin